MMSIYQQFTEQEIKILQERANRVAQDNTERTQQATTASLVVMLHNEVYALPVEQILTVYENVPIVPVPSVPAHIRGIANLRGHIIPVIDLSILLDVTATDSKIEKHYLIVVSDGTYTAALFVEKLGDILEFNKDDIKAFSSQSEADKNLYLQGITRSGHTIIDITKILHAPEKEARA